MSRRMIIFDLDGTLVDTLEDLAETGNAILTEFGFAPHPVDAYRHFVGKGVKVLIENILPQGEQHRVEEGLRRFQSIYMQNWQKRARPYDGIVGLIKALEKTDYPLAVLSNKPHDFTVLFVDHFFPDRPFKLVYGQQEGIPRKPDPAMALRILEELDCEAGQSWFVGDTPVDLATGNSAKMKSVGVTWGFRDEAELRQNGAQFLIDQPAQFLELI